MRNKAHGCGSFAVPVGFVLRFFCRGLYAAQFITSSSRCPIGLRVECISANVAAIQSG